MDTDIFASVNKFLINMDVESQYIPHVAHSSAFDGGALVMADDDDNVTFAGQGLILYADQAAMSS